MSTQEISITVSLFSYLLVLGYYLANLFQMSQAGGLVSTRVFTLWVVVIVAVVLLNIFGNILTRIVLAIGHAIKTNSTEMEEERFIVDERDRLIELKGDRVAYITFSIGVFLSMLTFAFGQPPLVMFSLIILFSILGGISGDISQFYYRRGI